MTVRRPAVAGSFYPDDPDELRELIARSYTHPIGPGSEPPSKTELRGVMACVCPHAGYIYSGPVAAHSYLWASSLRRPELVVVIGPNHYGIGSGISTFRDGEWATPLGKVAIDTEAARKIVDLTGIVDFDPESQRREHSIEVQLPFLQEIYHDFKFLPICLCFQDVETARELGKGLSVILKGRDAVLVASSDLTHYEPADVAKEKDTALLKTIVDMDILAFYRVLEERRVTACGYGAIATVMEASRLLGFKRGELHKYASSGDTTGDKSAVVGYPSVSFG